MSPSNRFRNYLGAVSPDESPDSADLTFEAINYVEIDPPQPSDGFFEFYSLLCSIQEAESGYVTASLGAHYGGPLVDAAWLSGVSNRCLSRPHRARIDLPFNRQYRPYRAVLKNLLLNASTGLRVPLWADSEA